MWKGGGGAAEGTERGTKVGDEKKGVAAGPTVKSEWRPLYFGPRCHV